MEAPLVGLSTLRSNKRIPRIEFQESHSINQFTTPPPSPVLELHDIAVHADHRGTVLLKEIGFRTGWNHLCAILGPSGCGKSTLLKAIAGVTPIDHGHLYWRGRDLCDHDAHEEFATGECGYVPQFSIAYEELTVAENVEAALRLRRGGLRQHEVGEFTDVVLADTGLMDLADRRASLLSGGQRRRLALAMELTSQPALMLCDELTSGLDPKSEKEMLHLLRELAHEGKRVILNVTHSLEHLDLYDSVLILHGGRVVFHGMPSHVPYYFQIDNHAELYEQLENRSPEEWSRSWQKHAESYYRRAAAKNPAFAFDPQAPRREKEATDDDPDRAPTVGRSAEAKPDETAKIVDSTAPTVEPEESHDRPWNAGPGFLEQTGILLGRRFRIFLRDRGQLALQCAMMIGFPLLVAVFALDGLPQVRNASMEISNAFEMWKENARHMQAAAQITTLVSGLVMFQVILLALMGANNGSREIAGERAILEKEKLAGLKPSAYVTSKAIFTGLLAMVQALAMSLLIQVLCRFEGDVTQRFTMLLLVNFAITFLALGISALSKTAERASLLAIYFVGFQLPLSGAVVALPAPLDAITRPFIAAYWGWAGVLESMRDTRFFEMISTVTETPLAGWIACVWFLAMQAVVGLLLAWIGSKQTRWG